MICPSLNLLRSMSSVTIKIAGLTFALLEIKGLKPFRKLAQTRAS
jgi:hypothetical protein